MKIDRYKVQQAFDSYVEGYNRQDEKIRLKIEHTRRVSALCEQIALSSGMSEEEADLAWLTGVLHDVGRFEQLRQFDTFIDAQSVDHAALGANILFEEGRVREYVEKDSEDELLKAAVLYHSAYRLPDGMSDRIRIYCHIIRDADKIDILKVNVDYPLEEIYNVSTKELREAAVTEAVRESFWERHATLRSLKQTPADYVVGHISLVFELEYPVSLRIVKEQGYLEKLMNFVSWNEETKRCFAKIREIVDEYCSEKMK